MSNRFIYTPMLMAIFSLFLWIQSSIAQENHLTARIIAETESLPNNSEFNIAIALDIQPGWHIYWDNAGDSGYKTEIEWKFDKKVNIIEEDITPTPHVFNTEGIINYGFKNNVLYITKAQYAGDKEDFALSVAAKVKYLICKDICLPEETTVNRTFTLDDSKTSSVDAPLFKIAKQRIPLLDESIKTNATLTENVFTLNIDNVKRSIKKATLIPYKEGLINDAFKQKIKKDGDTYKLTLEKDSDSGLKFEAVEGILNIDNKQFVKIKAPIKIVEATPKQKAAAKAKAEKLKKAVKTPKVDKESKIKGDIPEQKQFSLKDIKTDRTLQMTLLFAFVGGLILNLMPCVLPVLSLKVLSLLHHAKSLFSWWYGLVYTLGILATFGLLAFAMIGLKSSGEMLGWGFQLQSPVFVASLALLMLLIGLQLSNVFHFGASFGRLQNLVSGHGTIGTFFSGMLITVVATPCSAPFMATAIAFALVQPNEIIYLTFGALGLGLAFPYLIMTFIPPLLKLLPKPGQWEITFQQFLSFPMFATVLWLIWIYAKQTSLEKVFMLVVALFAVTFTTWIFGRCNVLSASKKKRWFGNFIFLLGVAYFFFTLNVFDKWYKVKSEHLEWEVWSTENVEEGLSQDRPVFVSFTADWCITCKVNEKIVLETESVRNFVEAKGIRMLMADWTSKDETISAELKKFDRFGVPLYLMYSPKDPENPKILKQILTPSEFKKSL